MANAYFPKFTTRLCDDVYALSREPTLEAAQETLNKSYNGRLIFSGSNMLAGKTGGPAFIKVKTAFGFVLEGQDVLKGNAFVVFRGTQYLADWLTNANVLFSAAASGERVHDGFNKAFKSMLPQIAPFIKNMPSNTTIHCLGHSLGGALATLCADWIKVNTSHSCFLYTFGSPRVGFEGFAERCTKAMGANTIFRAYHRTDIVPCIPIWPFVHTPNSGRQYYIYSPGDMPGGEWHSMEKYVTSVGSLSWQQLYSKGLASKEDLDVAAWLKNTAKKCTYSILSLRWISEALKFVISKCIGLVSASYRFAASSYSTLMDRLAYILAKGSLNDGSISNWVALLMIKIAQFLGFGHKVKADDKPNEASVRELLRQLQVKANNMAQHALSHALADGRAL